MVDVFIDRQLGPFGEGGPFMPLASNPCFSLHKIRWRQSLLAADGSRMLCHVEAPDAESVRLSLRNCGKPVYAIWTGAVRACGAAGRENIVLERRIAVASQADQYRSFEALQRSEWSMAGISLGRIVCSLDKKHILALFRAPGVQQLRSLLDENGIPFDRLWAFLAF